GAGPAPRRSRSPSAAPGQTEDTLGDDVPEDLRRAGLDRVAAATQLLIAPVRGRPVAVGHLRLLSDDLDGELGEALVRLGPAELRDRPLGAGRAGALVARQGAVVGVAEGLEFDPLASDAIAHQRVGERALVGQGHELMDRDV